MYIARISWFSSLVYLVYTERKWEIKKEKNDPQEDTNLNDMRWELATMFLW